MPELPEVQNTVNGLRMHMLGEKISSVWSDYDSSFYHGKENIKDPTYFDYLVRTVRGKTVTNITRRAKQIFISLDSGHTIVVHMKMTGHFLQGSWQWNSELKRWEPTGGFWNPNWQISLSEARRDYPLSDPYNNFIHLLFTLESGKQIAFSDMRKFATIYLLKDEEEVKEVQDAYGPEPLDDNLELEQFILRFQHKPTLAIKTALLDQSIVAGFGNIYSDEVLYAAGIHPQSQVGSIPRSGWESIFHEGQRILTTAILYGGDSMGDYRNIEGRSGDYQNFHQVYKQENTPCSICGSTIVKKQIGQRIGRFCPTCQKLYTPHK